MEYKFVIVLIAYIFFHRQQIQAVPASSSAAKDFKCNVIFEEIKENLDKVLCWRFLLTNWIQCTNIDFIVLFAVSYESSHLKFVLWSIELVFYE